MKIAISDWVKDLKAENHMCLVSDLPFYVPLKMLAAETLVMSIIRKPVGNKDSFFLDFYEI